MDEIDDVFRERLVHFFYLLMRNELPTGKVASILKDVKEADLATSRIYSNRGLEQCARDYASRILGEE